MSQNFKSIIYSIFFSILLFLFLKNPLLCTRLASDGLLSWFHTIIPGLFPFMVITSIMHELNIDQKISNLISPALFIFHYYSSAGKYCILIGLVCGFPMGAKTVVEQYHDGKISKSEAQALLPVCNQFSPAFIISVIYPAVHSLDQTCSLWKIIILIYFAPFLYCLINQYHISGENLKPHNQPKYEDYSITDINKLSLPKAMDNSLTKNILPIIKIGSYMIIFRVFSCLPELILELFNKLPLRSIFVPFLQIIYLNCTMGLEITTGILSVSKENIAFPAIMLYFVWYRIHSGGLSCLMQTYAFIEETDLSIVRYYRTKLLFGCITCIIFFFFHN